MPTTAPTTTAVATPTAQANAALSTTPVKASTAPQADNNPAATQAANASYAAANPNVFGTPTTTASTTTQSNSNKQSQVSGIQSTTNNLANGSGVTTSQNGSTTYANGTVYNSPQSSETNSTTSENSAQAIDNNGATTSGGYSGDTYYAPGQILPKDQNGNPISLTPTSPTNDLIASNLASAKSQADSLTATIIDNIQSSYANLIKQQQIVNSSQAAGANNNRLIGGVTGQGSTAQYASQTSNSVFTSVLNQGIQALGNLQSQENDAIVKAQQAGQQEDFQLMDEMNTQAQNIQTTKQNAANAINASIQAQAQKLQDAQAQQTKDNFVASQLQSGVTDPTQILANAKASGLTITAAEIGTSMAALSPDKAAIQSLAAQAAAAGANAATVAKITSSADFNSALTLATPALGAKVANDLAQQTFQNKIALAQLAVSQENANTAANKLKADTNAASQAASQAITTTPSGKVYVDGSNLSDAAKATAINNGMIVLDGDKSKAVNAISNIQGQLGNLLSTFKANGVDLSTGAGQTRNGFFSSNWVNAAGNASGAVDTFATGVKQMVSNLNTLPGSGNLIETLNANIPSSKDDANTMQSKLTAITSALESSENNLLASGIPKTATVNGKVLYLQSDGTYQ